MSRGLAVLQNILYSNIWEDVFVGGVAILFKTFVHESTITDKEGRYLILVGLLLFSPLYWLMYGPNTDSPSFYKHVLSQNRRKLKPYLRFVFGLFVIM